MQMSDTIQGEHRVAHAAIIDPYESGDDVLVKEFKATRNAECFSILYSRHYARVCRVCFEVLRTWRWGDRSLVLTVRTFAM